MPRTLLTVSLLLLPGWSLAAKPPNEAKIKALKAEIDKLRHEEGGALKQLDAQFKTAIVRDEKPEEREKRIRGRLEREEKEVLRHIDERFHHIIHHLEPREVHHQMEEALKTLRHVHEIVSIGNFDYGGHRKAAQDSIKAAEHQLRWALDHDTYEERAKAARDLHAAHRDLERALAYSGNRYGFGNGKPGGEPETRAAANRQLADAMPVIENTHHLLMAVDHEIKDYEHEKRELLKKRDEIKRKVHEEFHAQIHNLSKEIAQEEHQVKELVRRKTRPGECSSNSTRVRSRGWSSRSRSWRRRSNAVEPALGAKTRETGASSDRDLAFAPKVVPD